MSAEIHITEGNPAIGMVTRCCDLAEATQAGTSCCTEAAHLTCWLHSYIGEDGQARCSQCSALATGTAPEEPVRYGRGKAAVAPAGPAALVVLHALHVCGAARHCLGLLEVLRSAGVRTTVLTLKGGGHWGERFLARADEVVVAGSSVSWDQLVEVARPPRWDFVAAHYDPAISWAIDHVPDGVPIYGHFHTQPLQSTSRDLIRHAGRRFRRVIFPSEQTRAAYSQCAPPGEWPDRSVRVLGNVVSSEVASGGTGSVNGADAGPRSNIAIVSRLDEDKMSFELLGASLRRLVRTRPDVHVRVAGPGEDVPLVRALLDESGLTEQVELLGYVDDIATVYAWADALFLPSHTECDPYAALEAQAFGIPCVMPQIGAAQGSQRPSSVVTFPPGDATAAARALDRCLSTGFGRQPAPSVAQAQREWATSVRECYEIPMS